MRKIVLALIILTFFIPCAGEAAYQPPSQSQIEEDFQNPGRMRIILTPERLEEIRGQIATDSRMATWYGVVKDTADRYLTMPVFPYELRDGERLLQVANDIYHVVSSCAFVYLIEGDEDYAVRAKAEMLSASAFEDWHPAHFLDTAQMTMAMAVGYDWLYDTLSLEEKDAVRSAIGSKGLDAAMEAYDGTASVGDQDGAYHNRIGWKDDKGNWNLVCNGGIITGALAIAGDVSDVSWSKVVEKALSSMTAALSAYAPDGAWEEGVGYWEYGTRFLIYAISSLENTLGTDYEYMDQPGLEKTAYFPLDHIGPAGTFNFGDAGEGVLNSANFFWFAHRFDDPGLAQARLSLMDQYGLTGSLDDILFYHPITGEGSALPLDSQYLKTGTVTMRSAWNDKSALYAGIHVGSNGADHGDLDIGSFVLDALGQRWACDLGLDDYQLPGYWSWPQRANYYRKRAEGHNTLVINPDDQPDQVVSAQGSVTEFVTGRYGAMTVTDLTPAYAQEASSVRRAAVVFDGRSKFFVQDTLFSHQPMEVYWFMQTRAQIQVLEEGKQAILSIGDKRMLLLLESSDPQAIFTFGPAQPLPSSPAGTGQTPNIGVSRLAVHSSGVTNLNMRVVFVPFLDGEAPILQGIPEFTTIDNLTDLVNQAPCPLPQTNDYADDTQAYSPGEAVLYAVSPVWDGDNAKGEITVAQEGENRYICIREKGNGEDPLLYMNNDVLFDKTVMEFQIKCEKTQVQKRIYIRQADGNMIELFRLENGLMKSPLKTAVMEPKQWHTVRLILDTAGIDVSVNGEYWGKIPLTQTQFSQIKNAGASIRFHIIGVRETDADLCVDNMKINEYKGLDGLVTVTGQFQQGELTAMVKNTGLFSQKATLVVAQYEENCRLAGVQMQDTLLPPGSCQWRWNLPQKDTKLFLWNMDDMTPLCRPAVCTAYEKNKEG